jgi:hypothetical protein
MTHKILVFAIVKIIDETADDGNYAVYAYDCCDNNDDLSQTFDFKLNDWGLYRYCLQ